MHDYKTAKQAAAILELNPSRVRQLCIAGKLPGAFCVGDPPHKVWLIPSSSVDACSTAIRAGHRKPGRKPADAAD